jgi:hypothetical protein
VFTAEEGVSRYSSEVGWEFLGKAGNREITGASWGRIRMKGGRGASEKQGIGKDWRRDGGMGGEYQSEGTECPCRDP